MKILPLKLILALAFLFPALHAGELRLNTSPRVAAYFEKAKKNHPSLVAFLHKMPKGGDLHNHSFGAVNSETLVKMAAEQGMFFDRESKSFVAEKPSGPHFTPKELTEVYWKTGEVVQALSLRDLHLADESGHDRFFRAFDRFGAVLPDDVPILKEVIRRAANQEVAYLELMGAPRRDPAWRKAVENARLEVLAEFAAQGKPRDIDVRYIACLLRFLDPDSFRKQVEEAFATAAAMPDLVVGITILAPEDDWPSQEHFEEHMQIIQDALRRACQAHQADPSNVPPPPRLNLHAGELTIEYAAYESMTDRIAKTVHIGRASRIGHGTSVMWEDDVYGLLRFMRDYRVAVEFCPSSSESILGVSRDNHPFPLYWAAGVPVVVATDDEGIARSNLTLEYAKAAQWFGLSYGEIKWLSFNSLEYSFLPGESYFLGGDFNRPRPDAEAVAGYSQKAARQAALLRAFAAFEDRMEGVVDTFNW